MTSSIWILNDAFKMSRGWSKHILMSCTNSISLRTYPMVTKHCPKLLVCYSTKMWQEIALFPEVHFLNSFLIVASSAEDVTWHWVSELNVLQNRCVMDGSNNYRSTVIQNHNFQSVSVTDLGLFVKGRGVRREGSSIRELLWISYENGSAKECNGGKYKKNAT